MSGKELLSALAGTQSSLGYSKLRIRRESASFPTVCFSFVERAKIHLAQVFKLVGPPQRDCDVFHQEDIVAKVSVSYR